MKTLAIDYGTKKMGLAVSDSLGITIRPLPQIPNTPDAVEKIRGIIREEDIRQILVGLPFHADGNDSSMTRDARDFHGRLRKLFPEMEILLWDENYTTKMASEKWAELTEKKIVNRKKKKKEMLDSIAAAILLETFLRSSLQNRGESPE